MFFLSGRLALLICQQICMPHSSIHVRCLTSSTAPPAHLSLIIAWLQHSIIYPVLLGLTDFSSLPVVRSNAKQLLDCLPTYRQVLDDLAAALQGSDPAADMHKLLREQQASELLSTTSGQLLYTLQVGLPDLMSLKCPSVFFFFWLVTICL